MIFFFNANSAIFQLYHSENKLSFNEMRMSSELDFFSACSMKQQSAGRHVAVRVLMLYLYKNASRVVSVTLFLKQHRHYRFLIVILFISILSIINISIITLSNIIKRK